MRIPTIRAAEALRERLSAAQQIDPSVAESAMPPYMESFLAHLRLLIGVPFDYLVPDSRLLPDESIRFFYLDRSWTDRLVDGALAVGKSGTREYAHLQAHGPNVQAQLDASERTVRARQRGVAPDGASTDPAGVVTGFLLRSGAVIGWPGMEVRAFNRVLPPLVNLADAEQYRIPALRIELLSPSVLLALFDGIPKLVWCEEPHHGVQFGMNLVDGVYKLHRRGPTGAAVTGETPGQMVRVPMRASNPRVVAVKALQQRLAALPDPKPVTQDGSAAFAIELLALPWRQRFQGQNQNPRSGPFIPAYSVTHDAVRLDVMQAVQRSL